MISVERVPGANPDILRLLTRMHEESSLDLPPVNLGKVARALDKCSHIFVALSSGCVVGVLALSRGEHWFSERQFLGDLVFYVAPEYRATRAAHMLLRLGKEAAIMEELPLMMAVVDGGDLDRKERFYERCGLKKLGSVHGVGF